MEKNDLCVKSAHDFFTKKGKVRIKKQKKKT